MADRRHIHHYLLDRGFTHTQTLAILTGTSVIFGAVGYFGWRLNVPEPVLFWSFAVGFFAYHVWIGRAWRRLEVSRFLEVRDAIETDLLVHWPHTVRVRYTEPIDDEEEAVSAS